MRLTFPTTLLLLVTACAGTAPAPAAPGTGAASTPPLPAARSYAAVALPSTPIGRHAAAWLEARNELSPEDARRFYLAHYAPALLEKGPAEERVARLMHARMDGRAIPVRVERATDTEITVLLHVDVVDAFLRLTMKCASEPPGLVVESRAEDATPPDDLAERGPLDDASATAQLDAYVSRLAAHDLFSGSVVLARGGTPVYQRAWGLANKAYAVPNRVDTKFNLGSMNKMVTSVAIAQLVQAGKLAYGDTLASRLPDYPNQDVAKKITIHQLLTHTSGLGDYFTDEYESTPKDKLRAIKDYLPLFASKPLLFEPGTRFQYSNAGFMVLGAVVQKVSGEDYFEYVRKHVYAPAGMNDTDAYEMDRVVPNLAIGYVAESPSGAIDAGRTWNNLYLHVVKGGPAGGGFSTAPDLLRFASALLGHTLLDEALVKTLLSPKVDPGWGGENLYAYGFDVQRRNGVVTVGHSGAFPGINATLRILPDRGYVVAVMSNYDPPAADVVGDRAVDLLARVPAATPGTAPPVAWPSSVPPLPSPAQAAPPRAFDDALAAADASLAAGDYAAADKKLDAAAAAAGDDVHRRFRVAYERATRFAYAADFERAAGALGAVIPELARHPELADEFWAHNSMMMVREAQGDPAAALAENDQATLAAQRGTWKPEQRERLAFMKDRWHRAYLTRMLAQTRNGSARAALVGYARAALLEYTERARHEGDGEDSVAVLEAYFAALDGDRTAAAAAARKVDPAKDDDLEDLYLVVVGLEAGGDHASADAVRKVMRKPGSVYLARPIMTRWLAEDAKRGARAFTPWHPR